VRKSTNWKT